MNKDNNEFVQDEMLARLNRIYPNSGFVKVPKYNPAQWTDREYDSKFDTKAPLNRWKSKPLSYDEAVHAVSQGYRIGWVVPKYMCVVDLDNVDDDRSQEVLINLLEKWEVKYSFNYTSRGMHLLFQDPTGNIGSDSHCKCGINIDVDTRANMTGYIILPCNDPHREWGTWNDFVEEIPYFLKPLLRDNTPSFIGMVDGDGRNNALFKWRSRIESANKLQPEEIEKCIRIINEFLFETPIENKELYKTVLREKDSEEDTKQRGNVYNKLAKEFMTKFDIITFGDNFYLFNGTYYKPASEVDIERKIHFELSQNINKTGRNEIMEFLRIKTQVSADDFDKDWYKVAVKNGILNVVTGELSTPTKNDFNTIYIPWAYNDDPTYSPRIDQFMVDITGGDPIKILFLYQVAGYSLLKRNMFEKFFIFQGGGGTGKSTYMNIVQKMVGSDNTSNIGLADFDKDYYLASTVSKLLNIDDDVVDGKALENTGRFKSIVSGNKITVRQIYQPVLTFEPYCTLMFSCNKLPRIVDRTSGLYRRLVLIELNEKIEKPDMLFMLKLTDDDMEYFLFKSVEAVKLALEEGRFRISYSERDLLRKFKCRQSPLNAWLYESDYTLGDLFNRPCRSLYTRFITWCGETGYTKPPPLYVFKDDICALYDMEVSHEIKDGRTTTIEIFTKRGINVDMNYRPF